MHKEKESFEIFWKGKVSGPYSKEEITELIRKGEIGVWAEIREYGGKWQQLSKHPVLASRRKTKSSASPEKKKEPPSVPKIKKGKRKWKWKWKDRAEETVAHPEPEPEADTSTDPTTGAGHEEVQWFLQCFKGPDEGKRAALMPDTPLWIGDGEGVGIPSDDPDMSASIFGFELTNGHVWFNSSTDKTAYLDGVPMTQGTVHSGQQLRLGGSWWQLQINPKISNSANSTDDSGLIGNFSKNVSRLVGVDEIQGFSLSKVMSQVFSHHTQNELEDKFICGTPSTTPALSKVQPAWPEPWLFVRMMFITVLLSIGLIYGIRRFETPILIPGLLFIAGFGMPMSTLMLFWESNLLRNISLYQVFRLVVIGGLLSLLSSLLLYDFTQIHSLLGAPSAGVIEELGKLLIVILLMQGNARFKWIHNGMLLGAAVGAGFSAFETAGYLWLYLDNFMVTALGRGIFSPFTHIVWTAAAAAALWRVKGANKFSIGMLFDLRFLRVFIAIILLHAAWNSELGTLLFDDPDLDYFSYALIGLTGWIIVLSLYQEGLREIKNDRELL